MFGNTIRMWTFLSLNLIRKHWKCRSKEGRKNGIGDEFQLVRLKKALDTVRIWVTFSNVAASGFHWKIKKLRNGSKCEIDGCDKQKIMCLLIKATFEQLSVDFFL